MKVFALLYFTALIACNPASTAIDDVPEACKKIFQGNRIDFDLAKDFSIEELLAVEKCGFVHHPKISFYAEIISSREYPIPVLLTALRQSSDDDWNRYLVYLVKAVIESERFHSEVMRDRSFITMEVESALGRVHNGGVQERFRDLKDGIDMYFMKQDGIEF